MKPVGYDIYCMETIPALSEIHHIFISNIY